MGLADLANDRRAGHPATPSIPPVVRVRADLHGSLLAALSQVRAAGGQLPLRPASTDLPGQLPGGAPSPEALLSAVGRVVEVFPGTVLMDPTTDPVVIARRETPADSAFVLATRAAEDDATAPEESWVAKRATLETVIDDPPASARLVPVAPIFEAAGWYHPNAVVPPSSLAKRGSLVRLHNVTGLVAGESTLERELLTLHSAGTIARSALAPLTSWVWNGTTFTSQ